jgi:hypothetical protein
MSLEGAFALAVTWMLIVTSDEVRANSSLCTTMLIQYVFINLLANYFLLLYTFRSCRSFYILRLSSSLPCLTTLSFTCALGFLGVGNQKQAEQHVQVMIYKVSK